jgi:hypothetical protein
MPWTTERAACSTSTTATVEAVHLLMLQQLQTELLNTLIESS